MYGCHMLQVCDLHEGLVEVVKLQDAGQQEEARDEDTGEELGESKGLQTDSCKPANDKRGRPDLQTSTCVETEAPVLSECL